MSFEGDVRVARVDDAPEIARLIRRCYGDTYCPPFAEPAAIRREMDEGSCVWACALGSDGSVVGQAALTRMGSAGLYECARIIIDDAHRGRGLLDAIGRKLIHGIAPAIGARFVMGRAVTNHVHVQRFAIAQGMKATGLLLAMIPARVRASGLAAPVQATSAVVHVLAVERAPRPRTVVLGGRDGERTVSALHGAGVPARHASPDDVAPAEPLGCTVERNDALGVTLLRLAAGAPRVSLASLVAGAARESRVVWADVPIEHPGARDAAAALRELGLTYGTWLPVAGPRGEDVLRLQRVLEPAPLRREEIDVLDELCATRDELFDEAFATHAIESVS